jgi:hypothetical protein
MVFEFTMLNQGKVRSPGPDEREFDMAAEYVQASSGLSESCPKIGDVPKSPVPHIGSPGAVGQHNDTSNRVWLATGAMTPGHPA